MLNRRLFLGALASIPLAAVVVPTPDQWIAFDRGRDAGDWTCVSWFIRDTTGRIWLRPCPRFVRLFQRNGLAGIEGSDDHVKWHELVSTDDRGRAYTGPSLYGGSPLTVQADSLTLMRLGDSHAYRYHHGRVTRL